MKTIPQIKPSKKSAVITVSVAIIILIATIIGTRAAPVTIVMTPDATITGQFALCNNAVCGAAHHTYVDEGAVDDLNDYVNTGLASTANETEDYSVNNVANVFEATQIVVRVLVQTATLSSTADTVSVSAVINGGQQATTTCTPTVGSYSECVATYNGSYNQTAVDSLRIRLLRTIEGTGPAAGRDDDIRLANAYITLTYVQDTPFNQASYRWFENLDAPNGFTGFGTKIDYPANDAPKNIVNGDFNGDTILDLAVVNQNSNNVSVFLGTGDGKFGTKIDSATGTSPAALATGDINKDGNLDVVIVYYLSSATVGVMLGTGTGSFGAQTTFVTATNPMSVVVGDFNNDTNPDVATANNLSTTNPGNISVLLGNGTGALGTKTDYATAIGPASISSGDINKDGNLDLAVANYNSGVASVFLGTGAGTFGAKTDFTSGSGPSGILVKDFNKDGNPDIAVANVVSNNVAILLGTGTGSFAARVTYATGNGGFSVDSGDFNNDTNPDIVVANYLAGTVSVLLGTGSGTFGTKTDYGVGTEPYSAVAGDFNNDSRSDFAAANQVSDNISVILANTNAIDVGNPLAVQNTFATAPAEGTPFRLRLDIGVSVATLEPGARSLKLQYAKRGTDNICSTNFSGESYADIGTNTPISFYNNPNAGSGHPLVTNANDPTNGVSVLVHQSYNESNPFTSQVSIFAGQTGVWDFALTANGAFGGDRYCIRAVNSNNTPLTTYTVIPEIAIQPSVLSQSSYRFFDAPTGVAPTSFARAYGTSAGSNAVRDIIQTDDGGHVTAGDSSASGTTDSIFVKYDSAGDIEFSRLWGGAGTDRSYSAVQTSDGGYALSGFTNGAGGGIDTLLLKYDALGNLLFSETWGGTGTDRTFNITEGSNGNLYLTGDTNSFGAGLADMLLLIYSSTGTLVSTHTWGGTGNDRGYEIAATSDGGVAVGGETASFGAGGNDAVMVKFNSSGVVQYAHTWGGTGTEVGDSIAATTDGGVVLIGYTSTLGTGGGNDAFVAKYDNTGALTFSRTWGGIGNDLALGVDGTPDGGFAVTGREESFSGVSPSVFLIKYSSTGTVQLSRSWGGAGIDYAYAIASSSDGGYLIAGEENSFGSGSIDQFVIKYDSTGTIVNCGASCFTPSPTISTPTPTPVSPTGTVSNPTGVTASALTTVANTMLTPFVGASIPVNVGAARTASNKTLELISPGTPVRLRYNVRVDTSSLLSGTLFKLQYALGGSDGICDASYTDESYVDVTSASDLRYVNNTIFGSGSSLVTNANDPLDDARTIVRQTYVESGTFRISTNILAGQSVMWDFSLATSPTTVRGSVFCIRVVKADNTPLTPGASSLATISFAPSVTQLLRGGSYFNASGIKQPKVLR